MYQLLYQNGRGRPLSRRCPTTDGFTRTPSRLAVVFAGVRRTGKRGAWDSRAADGQRGIATGTSPDGYHTTRGTARSPAGVRADNGLSVALSPTNPFLAGTRQRCECGDANHQEASAVIT
jgi:hypothetical protein